MSCGGGSFSPDGAYDSNDANDGKIHHQLLPVPRGRWLCVLAE